METRMFGRVFRRAGAAVGVAALLVGAGVLAQEGHQPATGGQPHGGMKGEHVMLTPDEIVWKDGPDTLPPGAKLAVVSGDPKSAGEFTMRLKMPAGYRIAAHTHPGTEHVTVISGTLHMGTGDKLDTSKGEALPAGGFAVMPVGVRHFAWSDEETVVQVHGVGPWGITYVDPATDPRNKK